MSFLFSNGQKGNVQKSLAPYSFNLPGGTSEVDGKTYSYSPTTNYNTDQLNDARGNAATSAHNLYSQYGGPLNINDVFNNQYTQSAKDLLTRPLQQQQATDTAQLGNDLNAQNQAGSSYGALQNALLGRRYDQLYQNANDQAAQYGLSAYQQNFQNQLGTQSALQANLQGLRGDQQSVQQLQLTPLQLALQGQSVLNPNSQAQASYYQNLPSPWDDISSYINTNANAAGAILKGAKG